jgi:hypothetical protein
MIEKIKPTSVLDFQMLHSILAQRKPQILELIEVGKHDINQFLI